MIQFPCHCSYVFKFEDDMAGAFVQCPKCGRLNDVPTLSELPHLGTDGTYNMEAPVAEVEPDRLAALRRVFSKEKVDEDGQEIDLRPTPEQLDKAGESGIPKVLRDQLLPGRPRYDPETGQLIVPMDVEPEPVPPVEALAAARPAVHRAGSPPEERLGAGRFLLRMMMPGNLVVLAFIFLLHVLAQAMLFAFVNGFWAFCAVYCAVGFLLISHYGNSIDDLGPGCGDELPRPGRNMNWGDDLWRPFVNVLAGLAAAYAPAGIAMCWRPSGLGHETWIVRGLMLMGTLLAPATLLTTATSGTWINLRPDRLLGVTFVCGGKYVGAVILWVLACGVYAAGLEGMFLQWMGGFFAEPAGRNRMPAIVYLTLMAGIFLMHYFCGWLGVMYRDCHERFPWVLQRHESAREGERRNEGP